MNQQPNVVFVKRRKNVPLGIGIGKGFYSTILNNKYSLRCYGCGKFVSIQDVVFSKDTSWFDSIINPRPYHSKCRP